MAELHFHEDAEKRFTPFLEDLRGASREQILSVHITGSALTSDYDPKRSDINSVVVLKESDLDFLKLLAPLGKKHGKRGVAAPLIMTPAYIENSLDVFPVEFLNIRWIHHPIFGVDPFREIEVKRSDLRQQCERELKVRLIGLRQSYLSASGDRKILTENFQGSLSGYIPLFRAILFLQGKEPPIEMGKVVSDLGETTGVALDAFQKVLHNRRERKRLTLEELDFFFADYYTAIEALGKIVDEIAV